MASEIAQLLQVDQKKYVPNCTISDEKIILETVPLHGTSYLKRGQGIQNGHIRMVIMPGIELMEFLPSLQIGMQNLTCSW